MGSDETVKAPSWELGTVPSSHQGLCVPGTPLCARTKHLRSGVLQLDQPGGEAGEGAPLQQVTSGLLPLLGLPCGSKVRRST